MAGVEVAHSYCYELLPVAIIVREDNNLNLFTAT